MRLARIEINVNFPALQSLVDYLTAAQQGQVDSLKGEVEKLTASLEQKTAGLQASVDQQSSK